MPCLSSLVRGGVSGDLTSFAPFLSPMLWTTIATGHLPDRHGVHGFAEVDPHTGEARAVGTASRRTKALWNLVSEQGGRAAVVGWMGSSPAEALHGAFVSDAFGHAPANPSVPWPVAPGSVYPPALAEELADLRLRPEEVDPGLLGLFVPALQAGTTEPDPALNRLMQRLAQLYTLQNATIALVGRGQPDFCAVYFHFLDLICHEFVMYHPPRHPRVTVRDYARYKDVVSAAYRVQDALLGDLLRHCAPDTKVLLVSDHGFTTGAARPARTPQADASLAAWHRREGIVVAHGPGVAGGGRFAGVRPHDIAPTVLAWMGLPIGADMPGRVLAEMFVTAPDAATVPSWEDQPATVAPPAARPLAPEADEARRLTRRFIELGYVDPAALQGREGGQRVADENRAYLGTALRDLGRPEDALPHLHAAALAEPESPTRAVELGLCLMDLGLNDEAERALQPFFDHGEEQPRALLLHAQLLIARRRFPQALKMIDRMEATELSAHCGGLRRLTLLRAGRNEEARVAFAAALPEAPNRVTLHLGLGQACLLTGRHEEALAATRRALALDPVSTGARLLLDEITRSRETGRSPAPPDWETLTRAARQRAAWRTEMRARERTLRETRHAARQTAPVAVPTTTPASHPPILVVSGAPRSGTSMMMRMLALAGVPVLTDGVRAADASNPLGYFEWEPAKRLATQPDLITRAEGKVVKLVSPLLEHLPASRTYTVVFMRRDARAILASQERMIAASGGEPGRIEAAELERHIEDTLTWARRQSNLRLIELNFDTLLAEPEQQVTHLLEFIGAGWIKRPAALCTAIRSDLCHHRAPPSGHTAPHHAQA